MNFEEWKKENEDSLIEKFLDIHDFCSYLEDCFNEYQIENGIDEFELGDLENDEKKLGELDE